MSIVTQQLIGGTNLDRLAEGDNRNPFPQAPEWEGTPSVGFGGYRYAKDREQANVFGVNGDTLSGPKWSYFRDAERSTKYGGESGARPMQNHQTLLGQLAQFIDPTRAPSQSEWNTVTYAKQIAHSVMSSGQMRSLKDGSSSPTDTPGRPIYNSSGGAFTGYDRKNIYGISSWTTRAVEEVEGVEAKAATMPTFKPGRGLVGGSPATEGVEAVEGVEASNQEIFRATNEIGTGLRRLPVSPTA